MDEPPAVATAPLGEETIEDRYAVPQAWSEWGWNQDRLDGLSESADEDAGDHAGLSPTSDEEASSEVGDEAEAGLGTCVPARASTTSAPYSQLFTRLKQSN